MKVYDFPFAPNPRKLRVYLGEKGLAVEYVTVNLVEGEQHQPAFLGLNPMGGLPVLELDDGTRLSESLAIIEYLEELHPEPPMIGRDPLERARVRRLERIADTGVLMRVARLFHATRAVLPGSKPDPATAEAARAGLDRPLAVLDAELDGAPFLAGAQPTIADCTLFAAFEMARLGELDVERPANLQRWYEAFGQRPSAAL